MKKRVVFIIASVIVGFALCEVCEMLKHKGAPGDSIKDSLIAHYEFTGNLVDSSGLGNHAVGCGVEMTADREGNKMSACRFDGKRTFVRVKATGALDAISNSVSIAAWIKPAAWYSGFYMPIVCKGLRTRCYGLMLYGKGNIWLKKNDSESCFELCRFKRGLNVFARAYSKRKIELDCWQHVAITYGDGWVRAYLNGELIGKQKAQGPLLSECSDLFIGSDPDGDIEYFTGDMDDVRIYSRQLTSNDVEDLFAGKICGFRAIIRGLVRCFRSFAK